MACRDFTDDDGRYWVVWDIYPTLAERRQTNTGPSLGSRERRGLRDRRARLRSKAIKGSLSFEAADGERRRLVPMPELPGGWAKATADQLRAWCAMANPSPPERRAIE